MLFIERVCSHLMFDMAVSVDECMCLLRVRGWVGDLVLSDVCEASCVRARVCVLVCERDRESMCARACVYADKVGVCVCLDLGCGLGNCLNQTLICPLTLTATAFQPESKKQLQDAVHQMGLFTFNV